MGEKMSYEVANKAKANFNDAYTAPTPHAYVATMAQNGYEIGEQARPYCAAAVELLREHNGDAWPVQMLDLGCSYGIGSAFVKYGCSFDEVVSFFMSRAPRDYHVACESTRMWLNVTPPVCNVRTVGVDSSQPAIRFAVDAGLLDGGIARNYEDPKQEPTQDEIAWFRSCNLMISTGAIGYVTERTLDKVLPHLGKDYPAEVGPFAVITILRLFDEEPIVRAFARHGLRFGPVPSIRLPQRRFANVEEREQVLKILHDRGIDTREWEDRGKQYAELYVAAPEDQFAMLAECMTKTRAELEQAEDVGGYIHR